MRSNVFNLDKLKVFPLEQRKSKSNINDIAIKPKSLPPPAPEIQDIVNEVSHRILLAKKQNASIMLAFGAHLVKNGAGPILIEMMKKGWITHLATQGAGSIHDWEFAFLGRSEEDVRANVATGTFGTWDETGSQAEEQAGVIR